MVGDAVNLGFVNRVAQELVAVFYGNTLHIDGVLGTVGEFVFVDVDGVVLCVAQIDGINSYVTNKLGGNLGAAARAAHKESEG